MPVSGPHKSWLGSNSYYEWECNKCGKTGKTLNGGKRYAQDRMAAHRREAHGSK